MDAPEIIQGGALAIVGWSVWFYATRLELRFRRLERLIYILVTLVLNQSNISEEGKKHILDMLRSEDEALRDDIDSTH